MKVRNAVVVGAVTVGLFAAVASAGEPVPIDVKDDAGTALSGDPDHGEIVFKKCMVCHSIKAGENKIGPSLNGVVGRPAGSIPGFNYSAANKKSGITWSPQELFVYLKNPQGTVPGTKMSFPGLPKPEDRADIIAYLEKNSK
jgi:cytochrome c